MFRPGTTSTDGAAAICTFRCRRGAQSYAFVAGGRRAAIAAHRPRPARPVEAVLPPLGRPAGLRPVGARLAIPAWANCRVGGAFAVSAPTAGAVARRIHLGPEAAAVLSGLSLVTPANLTVSSYERRSRLDRGDGFGHGRGAVELGVPGQPVESRAIVSFVGIKEGRTVNRGEALRDEHLVELQIPERWVGNLKDFAVLYSGKRNRGRPARLANPDAASACC